MTSLKLLLSLCSKYFRGFPHVLNFFRNNLKLSRMCYVNIEDSKYSYLRKYYVSDYSQCYFLLKSSKSSKFIMHLLLFPTHIIIECTSQHVSQSSIDHLLEKDNTKNFNNVSLPILDRISPFLKGYVYILSLFDS